MDPRNESDASLEPLRIRPATESDQTALRDLFLASRQEVFTWVEPESLAWTDFEEATRDEPILVAEQAGVIVGFVSWWPPDDFIHNLFVDPRHFRRGIGRQLLAACLDRIGRPARLKCVQANERALAFYAKHGWKIVGEGTDGHHPYYLVEVTGP